MGKIVGIILLGGVAFVVLQQNRVIEWKNQATEKVNAAAKQNRLANEAAARLADLETLLNDPILQKNAPLKDKVTSALNGAQSALNEIQRTANQNDLGATISKLINKVLPGEDPQPTWLPPGMKLCPVDEQE